MGRPSVSLRRGRRDERSLSRRGGWTAAAAPVHGTGSSLYTWDAWAAALSSTHRVVRLNLPAFGLTGPRPDGDYRLDTYVAFLDRFASMLGLGNFALAGNSLGGAIAWRFAAAHPSEVSALILVDPGGYPRQTNERSSSGSAGCRSWAPCWSTSTRGSSSRERRDRSTATRRVSIRNRSSGATTWSFAPATDSRSDKRRRCRSRTTRRCSVP